MKQYSGEDVFKLVDTHGLPLEIVNMQLREVGGWFDVTEFISAAKSWPKDRIYLTLIGSSPLQGEKMEELKVKLKSLIYEVRD